VLGTVALTWLVWHRTWFGARLTDDELIVAMSPQSSSRDVQHGVVEITQRFDENRVGMDRWAKLLVEASRRPEAPVRVFAAFGMGSDAGRAEFAARLREIVASDPSTIVRRNAAPALAKSGDASARPTLRSMLEQFVVTSPAAGVVGGLPGVDVPVREDKPIGRVTKDDGAVVDVRSDVPGAVAKRVVADGARVSAGDPLLVLAPDATHALDAALALAIVGTKDDVDLLAQAAAPQSQFPADVKAVARQAMGAIAARGK
jgi:biotin carboxyl carrier protein